MSTRWQQQWADDTKLRLRKKKPKENFPQQHVLLAPPAAQLLHCNCRQIITVRIQFLSLSFRLYISLETLLAYSKMLLGWNTGINADSVQICTVRLAVFHEATELQVWPERPVERGGALLVTGQDVSECARLLPPSFPHSFCLLFQLTRTSWLCERQILGIEPASSFKLFTLLLLSRLKTSLCLTVTGEVSTRRGPHKAYTSQLLQHLSHDTTSYSYTWGGILNKRIIIYTDCLCLCGFDWQ